MSTDDPQGDDFGDDEPFCYECNGRGWIIRCPDDLCHGAGYCMHGDGEVACACNTDMEPNPDAR